MTSLRPFPGKDTVEQHSAFWKYTLISMLRQFEQILEAQFFFVSA
jgi:hypothetical protein